MKKTITSKHGINADVDYQVKIEAKSGLHVVTLKANAGSSQFRKSITIGTVDEKKAPPPSAEELRKMLETEMQKAADEAGWKEKTRLAFQELQKDI